MNKAKAVWLALWLPMSAWAGFFVVDEPSATKESSYLAEKENWVAHTGSTLHESILAWGKQAGWKIYWRASEVDYPILGNLVYEGTFEAAIRAIFSAHEKAERPLLVDGNARQKVLIIREKK